MGCSEVQSNVHKLRRIIRYRRTQAASELTSSLIHLVSLVLSLERLNLPLKPRSSWYLCKVGSTHKHHITNAHGPIVLPRSLDPDTFGNSLLSLPGSQHSSYSHFRLLSHSSMSRSRILQLDPFQVPWCENVREWGSSGLPARHSCERRSKDPGEEDPKNFHHLIISPFGLGHAGARNLTTVSTVDNHAR